MSEMDEIKNVEEEAENEMFDEPMVELSWKFNFDKMKFSMQVFRHKKPAYEWLHREQFDNRSRELLTFDEAEERMGTENMEYLIISDEMREGYSSWMYIDELYKCNKYDYEEEENEEENENEDEE